MGKPINIKYSDDISLPDSALRYTLEALIPFTESNLKLAFSPAKFFRDLDRIDRQKHYARSSIRRAYYQAKHAGLIVIDESGQLHISDEARHRLKPYRPKLLDKSCVMVIFDIPEKERRKRQHLRLILRELKFDQIQKSVWTSPYDCKKLLLAEIYDQHLEEYVQIYEAVNITQ